MGRETDIRADGKSPLTSYVNLLVIVPHNFRALLDRDAEAARILTDEPALPEAIRRAERWFWDRQRGKQLGKTICTPRIWTRRDEAWLRISGEINGRVYGSGFWPERRAARYLRWLWPRSGPSLHDQWFRRAFDEARQDGTTEVLCPKLEKGKKAFERMIAAARKITQGTDANGEFSEATMELGQITCELMDYTKAAGETLPASDDFDKLEADTPALSERQYLILQSLLELGATAADKRENTQEIATKSEGSQADANGFKEPIAELKRQGYIDTKEGRGGGCWLTVSGKSVAEKL